MKREVLLLKESQHDISRIAEYLEGVSVQATQRFHEALQEIFDQLNYKLRLDNGMTLPMDRRRDYGFGG